MDPEIDSEGLDAFDIIRILELAVGGIFLLFDVDALVANERGDVEIASLVNVIRRLNVASLERLRHGKRRSSVCSRARQDRTVELVGVTERARRVERLQIQSSNAVLRVHVPQRQSGRDPLQHRVGCTVLSSVAGKDTAADKQTRAPIVERAVGGEIAGVGELPFLVPAADTRGRIVELARVEIRRDADVVPKAFADDTVNTRTQLPPGRRNDAGFNLVALHSVVSRRLVGFVENAKRDQEQSAFHVRRITDLIIEPGLFDLGFAVVSGANDGVLELDLRMKANPVVEPMVEAEDEALQVGPGVAALAKLAVTHFAVTDDICPAAAQVETS